MKSLSYTNCYLEVSGNSGGAYLISNLTYAYNTDPQELDLPSGAWWIWPVCIASVQVDSILDPGQAPPAIPGDTAATLSVTASGQSFTIDDCYKIGINFSIQQVGEAMPAVALSETYIQFKEDNAATGTYPV